MDRPVGVVDVGRCWQLLAVVPKGRESKRDVQVQRCRALGILSSIFRCCLVGEYPVTCCVSWFPNDLHKKQIRSGRAPTPRGFVDS